MMSSLFSAVAGLRAHQTRMDVIGNNVANVNTLGYKSSRVNFQEVFSQTLRAAGSPSKTSLSDWGGTNPIQIGLGVNIASMNSNHTCGTLQPTSNITDCAIDGEGFFVVQAGGMQAYTRVGAFGTDGDGILVDSQGRKVLGWVADEKGVLPSTTASLGAIRVSSESHMPASATTYIEFAKNLNCEDAGDPKKVPVTVYDSQGKIHTVTVIFQKDTGEPNKWTWSVEGEDGEIVDGTGGDLEFDGRGVLSDPENLGEITFEPPGAEEIKIAVDFSMVTQVAGPTTIDSAWIDGCSFGTYESFSLDSSGTISAFYSNGQSRVLAQIAIAKFSNPSGLQRAGNSLYLASNNSGEGKLNAAGQDGRGSLCPSSLEMSNVDLAEEFTQMIVTQRGFQANSRIISVSDELLQELVNIKR